VTTTYAPMTEEPSAPAWARADSVLAPALETLRAQINAHWPKRDHGSDGTIGDAAHLAEGNGSDHCPWLDGTVRALDVDVDGIDAHWLAESLRRTGAAGDHRLTGGGYVIFDGQITTPDFSGWVKYTGGDPHTSHVHVSATRNPAGFRDASGWAFLDGKPMPVPQPRHPGPVRPTGHDATGHGAGFRAHLGDQGPRVEQLQHELNEFAPAYSHLVEDGIYGEETAAVLEQFDHREAVDPATPAPRADVDGLLHSDGEDVGPRTAAAVLRDGIRL